jgi:prepilin-type N-terminal cleavage/methylation domain-containing protein
MMALRLNKRNRGFTLVELMVAMTLGLIVLWAVLKIVIGQTRANAVQQQVVYAQQNVRAGMDLMAREIRNAGYNPTNASGFQGILAASGNYIRIQSDMNRDGDTEDPRSTDPDFGGAPAAPDLEDPHEDMTYKLDNLTLLRGERINDPATFSKAAPAPWTAEDVTMVENVIGLQFGYILEDGTVLDPPGAELTAEQMSNVRTVIIRLGVQTEKRDPDTRQFRVRRLATRVRIRNMGFQDLE